MTVRSTAALIELRALIGAGEFTGTRIRRLILRVTRNYPDADRLPLFIDMVHRYLEQAEAEQGFGVPTFSLQIAMQIIDEFEEAERTGEIPKAHR